MCRLVIMISALYACSVITFAQNGQLDLIMRLLGTDDPESVDMVEAERLGEFLERPLRLNSASQSKLSSSGLLTGYQVASLLDYRTRHGDIMSMNELTVIDGFTPSSVEAIAPFISLQGGDLSEAEDGKAENDLAVKCGLKRSDSVVSYDYGLKYKTDISQSVSTGFSLLSSDLHSRPRLGSSYISIYLRRLSSRIVVGDFNARFGQGLALWNGMAMSGFASVNSFFKKTSGLSTSWSYTGSSSLTGLAAELNAGRFTIVPLLAMPGIKKNSISFDGPLISGLNSVWRGRFLSVSCTHYSEISDIDFDNDTYVSDMKTSLDVATCIQGMDIFAEVAFDWVNAVYAAFVTSVIPVSDSWKTALNIRYYPYAFSPSRSAAPRSGSKCSDENGASICVSYDQGASGSHKVNVSADASRFPLRSETIRRQLKLYADWEARLTSSLLLKVRASERLRDWGHYFRTDVRADLLWTVSDFSLGGRINYLRCIDNSLLGYLEGGYRNGYCAVFFRSGIFFADNWDDRIYVYERDAPGTFNVPAFYGRGVWVSLTGSWKFARWGRIYLRGSSTSYPFMIKKKPGKAELKLQCVFSF